MTPRERIVAATGLIQLAKDLQDRGHPPAAGEMLWGAVKHIIAAIAECHSLYQKDGKLKYGRFVMDYLQEEEPADPPLRASYTSVGNLHAHFYNQNLSHERHTETMASSFEFAGYLLARPEVSSISTEV